MQTTLSQEHLVDYLLAQLRTFFPDRRRIKRTDVIGGVSDALTRLEHCFLHIRVRRYCADEEAVFDHLYSDQYLMFLWFVSNSLWRSGVDENILNKIFLLNKCLHGFDCAFDTHLPNIFVVIHGVGTVLGKATYADFFTVYQGCTVGQTQGIYPQVGRGVGLGAGASLIGKCVLGDYASVGAGCTLINTDVEAGASVFRDDKGHLTARKGPSAAISQQYFGHDHWLESQR